MKNKLKAQGAIEYLLILGAVLIIAAIVVALVMAFTSKGPSALESECLKNAIPQARATLSSLGYSANTTEGMNAIKSTCLPCYQYDQYFIDTGKRKPSGDTLNKDEFLQGMITGDPTTGQLTIGTKTINKNDYPYLFKCLTVSPA